MRVRLGMVATVGAVALALAGGAPAHAAGGDPAGETLPVCAGDLFEDSSHTTACVNRSTPGWGVEVIAATGESSGWFGPESYTWVAADASPYGVVSFRFTADAQTYAAGPAYPKGIDF